MPAEGLAVWLRACRLPTMTAVEEQRVSRADRENWDDQRRRQHWCESEAQDRQEMEVLFTFLAERCERRSVLLTSNLVFSKWDPIFKAPMTTMAAIERRGHHATIFEFTKGSFSAHQATARRRSKRSLSPPILKSL